MQERLVAPIGRELQYAADVTLGQDPLRGVISGRQLHPAWTFRGKCLVRWPTASRGLTASVGACELRASAASESARSGEASRSQARSTRSARGTLKQHFRLGIKRLYNAFGTPSCRTTASTGAARARVEPADGLGGRC